MLPRFESLTVNSGSRLHFGLLRFGHGSGRQFGGVGAMIDMPRIWLSAKRGEQFSAAGPLAERVAAFAETWRRWHRLSVLPAVAMELKAVPPEHSGLGVGTQLGLAVARALEHLSDIGPRAIAETAQSVGRGRRSAIGVHGFELGGLIHESGKLPGEALSPLAARVALPEQWRFLLLRPSRAQPSLTGESEARAFEEMPPVPEPVALRLAHLAEREIVPAARDADFPRFAAAVGEYNQLSGSCYKSSQGGAFASRDAAEVVARLQTDRIVGVGQSSWGPTLFALFATEDTAQTAVAHYRAQLDGWSLEVSSPRNTGAEDFLAADEHG